MKHPRPFAMTAFVLVAATASMLLACGRSETDELNRVRVALGLSAVAGHALQQTEVQAKLTPFEFELWQLDIAPRCEAQFGCLWSAKGTLPSDQLSAVAGYADTQVRVLYAEPFDGPLPAEGLSSLGLSARK